MYFIIYPIISNQVVYTKKRIKGFNVHYKISDKVLEISHHAPILKEEGEAQKASLKLDDDDFIFEMECIFAIVLSIRWV